MELYDKNIYIEPDGSKWVRVFHHSPYTGGYFNSNDDFVNGVYHNENCWFQMSYFNTATEYEIMLKQLPYSGVPEKKYRWIQYANPMIASLEEVTGDNKIVRNNSEGYVANFRHYGIYKHSSENTYLSQSNGHSGDWWGALGCWSNYSGGIPGFAADDVVSTGYIDVYARLQSSITVDKDSLEAPYDGGTDTITVSSEGSWNASIEGEWISLDKSEGPVGDTLVNVSIAPNKGMSRTGKVTFTSGEDTVEVTVSQEKAHIVTVSRNIYTNGQKIMKMYVDGKNVYKKLSRKPKLELSTETLYSPNGKIVSFDIKSNIGWEITNDAEWVSLSETSGKGNATITVSCENTDEERTAIIKVRGKGEARDLERTLTLIQTVAFYTVNLHNDDWRLSPDIPNPDPDLYDGVYESYESWNQPNTIDFISIDIEGYNTFSIYVRSNGEGGYDYVSVYALDKLSGSMDVIFNTKNKANAGTDIGSYSLVTFTDIPEGPHTITLEYRKDGSGNSGTDRGYLLIPKRQ